MNSLLGMGCLQFSLVIRSNSRIYLEKNRTLVLISLISYSEKAICQDTSKQPLNNEKSGNKEQQHTKNKEKETLNKEKETLNKEDSKTKGKSSEKSSLDCYLWVYLIFGCVSYLLLVFGILWFACVETRSKQKYRRDEWSIYINPVNSQDQHKSCKSYSSVKFTEHCRYDIQPSNFMLTDKIEIRRLSDLHNKCNMYYSLRSIHVCADLSAHRPYTTEKHDSNTMEKKITQTKSMITKVSKKNNSLALVVVMMVNNNEKSAKLVFIISVSKESTKLMAKQRFSSNRKNQNNIFVICCQHNSSIVTTCRDFTYRPFGVSFRLMIK